MKKTCSLLIVFALLFVLAARPAQADRRRQIFELGLELEKQAVFMAESSFTHFKDRNNTITDDEQAALFKSEAFLASSRLFLRLTEERSDYFQSDFLRTNLYSAFLYLTRSLRDLEEAMKRAGVMPYALSDCRSILAEMDAEFSKWPAADNLAYLHQKYVKARNATVYMIERKGVGQYVRHAFKDLESIFRYNYNLKRGQDPWKYLVDVSGATLENMEEGEMIELTFEGVLVIEMSNRPNRGVYLIEKGKKRVIANPRVLQRFGGWAKVLEVPAEIIDKYPEGNPVL